jgi:DNA-binding transcriptional MerR regulator
MFGKLLLLFLLVDTQAFLNPLNHRPFSQQSSLSRTVLHERTTDKAPLYDGTNYTFPDTTAPDGIAEILEVSFVNACMQLRTGYVDILKMFIAAAMTSYQLGFSIDEIEKALAACPNQTANRPLMPEEVDLRSAWASLIYLTLASINHPTRVETVAESIPDAIHQDYGALVEQVAAAHKQGRTISVEELLQNNQSSDLSEVETAIRSQSMRVVTLTLVVLNDALEASMNQAPPKPPIKGAFDSFEP